MKKGQNKQTMAYVRVFCGDKGRRHSCPYYRKSPTAGVCAEMDPDHRYCCSRIALHEAMMIELDAFMREGISALEREEEVETNGRR